jgi:hypothetical protein
VHDIQGVAHLVGLATDTDYAHELAEALQSKGLDIWIDARLDHGSQWPRELQKQSDSCGAFIVIMTPRSFASEWVQSELQRARRKWRFIPRIGLAQSAVVLRPGQ